MPQRKGVKFNSKGGGGGKKKKSRQPKGESSGPVVGDPTNPFQPTTPYSVLDLLIKADEFIDTQPQLAEKFYLKALQLEPENTDVMDSYATLLLDMQEHDKAQELLTHSIKMAPDNGFYKYLHMAQFLSGQDAIQCYAKALQIMVAQKASMDKGEMDTLDGIEELMCSTLVSQAELYLTDECFAPNAEAECERILLEALKVNPEHMEALQTMASFKISQVKPDDAMEYLNRSYNLWKDHMEDDELRPPLEVCHNTAKLFFELEQPKVALRIWEVCVDMDDTDPELHFCLGLAARHFRTEYAMQAFDRAKELLTLEGGQDKTLLTAVQNAMDEVSKENKDEVLSDEEEGEDDQMDEEMDDVDEDDE